MNLRLRSAIAASGVLAALALPATDALAATCDVNGCFAQIQAASGVVVNDIFRDANNRTADQLPIYGKLINNWPNCFDQVDFAGAGHSNAPFDCPGEYTSDSVSPTVANANVYLGSVDRQWWQPCRLNNPTISNGCPIDWTCIPDGTGGNYNPWQGLVFDLGGPSNKVVIVAENDHGPQPCESLEYTIFLTDNPYAQDQVLDPATQGVDPTKWNRAVLTKIYTGGWTQVRPPDPNNATHAACGDTAEYSVEEDSFVQVFSLPCGITFRYASIVAGNDGRDFPACAYDSNEAELDAVAGLTESGAAVCPDNDHDGYVDCSCPGAPAPPACDCNDADPKVHPGAPEACDATVDNNCDGTTGSACPAGTVCYMSVCDTACTGTETSFCPTGTTCTDTAQGKLCTPVDCGCAPGQVCVNNKCQDSCLGVLCPGTLTCRDGNCVDPCTNLQCPAGQTCQGGVCSPPCNCYAGDLGCTGSNVCDTGSSNQCVAPTCKGVSCPAGQTCDPTSGQCVGFCNSNVMCPVGQKCVEPTGCVPLCTGVSCTTPLTCDPSTGQCVDNSCMGVTCFAPQVCMGGVCVTPDGGSGTGGAGGAGGAGGSGGAGGAGGSGGAGGAPGSGPTGKCGCRTVGDDEGSIPGAAAMALLGLAMAAGRRRRR